jgi:DNA-binding HxlR family transcriptional regulator
LIKGWYKQITLTDGLAQRSGGGDRAGAAALYLLSTPLNVHVVHALADDPRSLIELRRVVGSPAQTTMRSHLKTLTEIGVLERNQRRAFPGSVTYELTRAGRELLAVEEVLRSWLGGAPDGPREVGSIAARGSIKALAEGWSTCIVRAVAARPLTLTELSKLISALNYPSLERRLAALRLAGLVEPVPGSNRGTPYTVSTWLRRAVAPLVAAARWEQSHVPLLARPLTGLDIEAIFLLVIPLLQLPAELSGSCRLAVEIRGGGETNLAGVVVAIEKGRVVSCVSRLRGEAAAWVCGSASSWLDALIDHGPGRLEVGGDATLADAILDRLHGVLLCARARA